MTAHAPPPADLATRRPRIRKLKAGTLAYRFYTATYGPIHFDSGRGGRLNAPDGSYGVLYLALSPAGAFAETFLRTPGRTLLEPGLIAAKAYVEVALTRDAEAIELHGPGAAVLRATAELTHGPLPYDLPQAWSRALHGHPTAADGLAYRARHNDDEICLAVFDRAADAMQVVRQHVNLDADWFYDLMEIYGVGIAPDGTA